MNPIITENHSESQVNVRGIVDRIIRHQKPDTIKGLNEISLLDNSIEDMGFGCYRKTNRRIEIYLDPILKWQPWILKKTYLFTILVNGFTSDERTDRIRHRLYEIEWESGEVISSIVRNREQWNSDLYQTMPFHQRVRQEGVRL